MGVIVHSWRKYDPKPGYYAAFWTCWVQTTDQHEFIDWMHQSMVGDFEATFTVDYRGDPYISIRINNDDDAMMFKLTWCGENFS